MGSNLGILTSYLELRDNLTENERHLINSLPHEIRLYKRHDDLVKDHSSPNVSCVLTKGYAARAIYMESGKRQLTAVHIPGDFVDLHALLLKVMDHSVVALTDCEAAFIPHEKLRAISEDAPHLSRLLWLSTVIDAAISRAWLTCIGRRSPSQHIAHLFCEIYVRLQAVGLAADNSFSFPITQSDLADMLGLSIVHVNKTLAQLRAMQMFVWKGTTVEIGDFAKLATFADFDPVYLSLAKIPR